MDDRDRVYGLVGRKVTVKLNNVEARGVEIIGTLDEVRDGGIVLSEIGELGPGPTMFCPWDSLRRVRERPWRLRPPHEEPGPDEPQEQGFFELREATADEAESPAERERAAARNLDRVVPIAQRQTVGEVTVALASLDRELSWSPQGSGGSDIETDGEVEIRDLPESGDLEVEVTRLASLVFDEEAGEEVEADSCEGPWTFRYAV